MDCNSSDLSRLPEKLKLKMTRDKLMNKLNYKIRVADDDIVWTWTLDESIDATNVVVPEGVTSIGSRGVSKTNVKHIKLPNSLTNIDNLAFANCDELEEIVIPSSVDTIRYMTFAECQKLKKVVMNARYLEIHSFIRCPSLTSVTANNVERISASAFENCTSLRGISLPSIVRIDHVAFKRCLELSEVDLGEKLERIDRGAFAFCPKLTKIRLPKTLKSIDIFDLIYHSSIKEVHLSRNTKVENYLPDSCSLVYYD